MSNLTITLSSGRILLLNSPLTAEELAEAQTPIGMALLELVADRVERRATRVVEEGDAEYEELKERHGL